MSLPGVLSKHQLRKIASAYIAGSSKSEACAYAGVTELAYNRHREAENDVLGDILVLPYEEAFKLAKQYHKVSRKSVSDARKIPRKFPKSEMMSVTCGDCRNESEPDYLRTCGTDRNH